VKEIGLFEAINTLRSIRRFKPEPVEEEKIKTILEAAIKAPNASMMDPWHFVVVRDLEKKKKFSPLYHRAFKMYHGERYTMTDDVRKRLEKAKHFAENIHEVPVMIFVFMDPRKRVVKEGFLNETNLVAMYGTIFPAIQNMMLAARGLGLGSVLTTMLNLFEGDVKEILGVPEHIKLVAMVAVGYPAVKFGPPRRNPLDWFVHWEHW